MFETLFSYPTVRRRHREGPLAAERASYLEDLAAGGAAHATLQQRASTCLRIARELERWPRDHCFSGTEVEALCASWAEQTVKAGLAVGPKWPQQRLRFVTKDFLAALGRLQPDPVPPPGRYDDQLEDFITAQRQRGWLAAATCRSGRWQVEKFLCHIEDQGSALERVHADHIDAYFRHVALKWSRNSVCAAAKALRAWFRHCEARGWAKPGLAESILQPRIYRLEGLPLGPTWDEVGRMIASLDGDGVAALRDRAILLLLAVYGLRSGEVRRLRLDDIDWQTERIQVVRSKSGRQDNLPLDPGVGAAIARYLRDGRPRSASRILFLTVRAPFRPLSPGGIYHVVKRHLSPVAPGSRRLGPQGLRHACARHLVASGFSFKEIGDHLGHRSPDSTRVYAKVDLASLRLVAFEDLGGLA